MINIRSAVCTLFLAFVAMATCSVANARSDQTAPTVGTLSIERIKIQGINFYLLPMEAGHCHYVD
jgi:hypothetical protein